MTHLNKDLEKLLEYEGQIKISEVALYESEKIKIRKAIRSTLYRLQLQHLIPLLFIQLDRGYLNQIIHYYIGSRTKCPPPPVEMNKLGALYNILHKKVLHDNCQKHIEVDLLHQGEPYRNIKMNYRTQTEIVKRIVKDLIFILRLKVSYIRPIKLIYFNNGKLKNEISKVKGACNLRFFSLRDHSKPEDINEFQIILKDELDKNRVSLDSDVISASISIKTGRDAILYDFFIKDLVSFIGKYKVKAVLATSSGSPNDLAILIAARLTGIKTYFCHHGFSSSNNSHLNGLVDIEFSFDEISQDIPEARVVKIGIPWAS